MGNSILFIYRKLYGKNWLVGIKLYTELNWNAINDIRNAINDSRFNLGTDFLKISIFAFIDKLVVL